MSTLTSQKRALALAISAIIPSVHAAEINWEDEEHIAIYGYTPLSAYSEDDSQVNGILTRDDLSLAKGATLARMLDSQLLSVSINDVQNNPFQTDVQYRGFTASPLLGLPQGLSVYLNGTRFNEPFGDTINWDLLPASALDSASMISGANPLFGQNTLGGALSLRSKTGFSYEDNKLTLQGGSYGQKGGTFESGGNNGEWGYYINASIYEEDGWRDYSPSQVKQLFGTVTRKTTHSETLVTLALADNDLIGNGAIPVDLIAHEGRDAIYTRPDQTLTNLTFVSLNHHYDVSDSVALAVNAYYRQNDIDTYNGDDSDYKACDVGFGETLCEEGEDDDDEDKDDEEEDDGTPVQFTGYLPDTPISDIISTDPEELDGTANTSSTENQGYGVSFELSGVNDGNLTHHWVFGGGLDKAEIDFRSRTEFAILANDTAEDTRGVTGVGVYDADSEVFLKTDVTHYHLLFSDTLTLSPQWQLWVAARYNHSEIEMRDQIDEGEGSLNGDHSYSRLNPSVGLQYLQENGMITLSYSQSSRTPSPAELSCADEDDPCKLPNGFVADPPLDQVITDTLELRYQWQKDNTEFAAAVYHSDSDDDIIFQQAGDRASVGYFVNIDKTRRQGAEISARQHYDSLSVGASASYLKATYESEFTSFSPQNPLGPNRQVEAGDTIPGQPAFQAGLDLDWQAMDTLVISATIDYTGGQYFRGDEANENRKLGGYTLLDISASWQVSQALELGLRIDNVLDKDYDTFGTYGEADEVLEDIYDDIESTEFVGVGQPRTFTAYASWLF
ncbi:TonB-dependent receptor [Alteromonas sp. 14N.309.X.WAT.G.H12]|uniref:TonB-dependent receptor n=1 Tax=Alteromonas sp. 14N.309.X.WAT.G.H12 TaxID=3120824 RepID=UPI002FD05B02